MIVQSDIVFVGLVGGRTVVSTENMRSCATFFVIAVFASGVEAVPAILQNRQICRIFLMQSSVGCIRMVTGLLL